MKEILEDTLVMLHYLNHEIHYLYSHLVLDRESKAVDIENKINKIQERIKRPSTMTTTHLLCGDKTNQL